VVVVVVVVPAVVVVVDVVEEGGVVEVVLPTSAAVLVSTTTGGGMSPWISAPAGLGPTPLSISNPHPAVAAPTITVAMPPTRITTKS